MLDGRSWVLCGLLLCATGCGARTIADDYRRDGGATPDVALPDAPGDAPDATPDVQPDRVPVCPPGTTLCAGRCIDTSFDPQNCGGCGVACGPMGACSRGTCVGVACVGGFTFCSGACVDLRNDSQNCGACGVACPVGTPCSAGLCLPTCPGGLTRCGRLCVNTATDTQNCGACNNLCPSGTRCSSGRCETLCTAGQVLCGGVCANPLTDPANCGRCGMACRPGLSCVMGSCVSMPMTGNPFRITTLTPDNCRTVEHADVTGDDRGGIAIGNGQVFYTGDTTTVGFELDTLTPRSRTGTPLDGLFGETSLGLALTLASNRTPLTMTTSIIDAVLTLGVDGRPSTTPTALSDVIFLDRSTGTNNVGIFGGAQRVIVTQGSRAWIIQGESTAGRPTVTSLMIRPIEAHTPCESWATWGVAEFFEGAPWVVYVRDASTIARQNLVTGEVRPVAVFTNLSDMCSFTVSPTRNRWYFHHEGTSQFRGGDETLGYCDATFSTTP